MGRAAHITNTDLAAFTSRCAAHFQQMLSEKGRASTERGGAFTESANEASHPTRDDHEGENKVELTPNSLITPSCPPITSCGPKTIRKCLKSEREKGFEPSTSTLARWHSTTELLPQNEPAF